MESTTPETPTTDVELATEPAPVLELTQRRQTLLAEPTDKKVNLRISSGKDEEEEDDGEEEGEEEELWKEEETDDQGSRRAGGGDAKSGNVSRLNVAMNIRRTIAEDLLWTLRTVPRLDELILMQFIQTFAEEPIDFDLLLPGQQRFVLQRLALDLPLPIVANRILDEDYWQRRCSVTWKGPFDISLFAGSWKRMFFENFVQRLVENFVPRLTDPEAFFEEVKVGGQFVVRLDVRQLLPPVKRKKQTETDAEEEWPEDDDPMLTKDHLRISRLAPFLSNLEELRITYGVEHCGMNFDWNLFRFTVNDCAWLTEFIGHSPMLRSLTIHRSRVDDARMLMLVEGLTNHASLTELCLAHNILRDDAARIIARFIDRNEFIQTVDLQNNEIGTEGGYALAYCLTHNTSLRTLNVRLNLVKDGGARAFARALGLNSTLVELNLACNGITCDAANALGDLLENNSTLKRLDLSGNLLDQECGRRVLQSMERNCSLTDLELRLTQCGAENLYCIGLLLAENRTRELHCQENSAETESEAERTSRLLKDCVEERPRKSRISHEKHI